MPSLAATQATLLSTTAHSLAQASLGMVSGAVLDFCFPARQAKPTTLSDGLWLLAEVLGQMVANTLFVSELNKGIARIGGEASDPSGQFAYILTAVEAQPELRGKVRDLVGALRDWLDNKELLLSDTLAGDSRKVHTGDRL